MPRSSTVFGSFAALLVLILALAAAGCGTVDRPPGGDGSSTTSPPSSTSTTFPPGTISHPTGADEVVLRVSTGGGFVPIEYNYTMVPEFTLYGDGRIIVKGPTTEQFPGRALPNLQTTVVSEEAIQAILAAAKEAGLFQNGIDYGSPGVADVGTTTFTVNADGTTYTSQIYALGFEDGGNLTMQQQQARAAISDLQGKVSDPSTLIAAQLVWEPYDFTALEVYSRPVDPIAEHRPDRHPAEPSALASRRPGDQRRRGGQFPGTSQGGGLRRGPRDAEALARQSYPDNPVEERGHRLQPVVPAAPARRGGRPLSGTE